MKLMMRRSLLIAAFLAGAAMPAQGQLKKIKGAITKAVPPTGSAAATPAGTGVRTADLQFDDRVLEITAARLEQLVKGIEAGQAMAAKVEAQDIAAIDRSNAAAQETYDREYRAYEAKQASWERCSEKEIEGVQKQLATVQPTENDRARLETVAARVKAAKERNDMAEVMRLTDSLTKAMTPGAMKAAAIGNAAPANVTAKCGAKPQEPARPARQEVMGYDAVDRAAVAASGLTDTQFNILRERVAPFVVSGGKSSPLVYTDTEVNVLREWQSKLEPFTDYFKQY